MLSAPSDTGATRCQRLVSDIATGSYCCSQAGLRSLATADSTERLLSETGESCMADSHISSMIIPSSLDLPE